LGFVERSCHEARIGIDLGHLRQDRAL
jgi:hypothetical protein